MKFEISPPKSSPGGTFLTRPRKSRSFIGTIIGFMGVALAPMVSAQGPVWDTAGQKTDSGANSTSLSVDRPDAVVAGDLIILVFTQQRSAASATSGFTTPAGFSQIVSSHDTTSTATPEAVAFYKIATASEPATYTSTVTNHGSNPNWAAVAARVTGHDPNAPIGPFSESNSGETSVATIGIPGVTPAAPNSLLVAARTVRRAVSGGADPTDMVNAWIIDGNGGNDGDARRPAFRGATQSLASISPTGVKTFEWTGPARAAGLMFVINPTATPSIQGLVWDDANLNGNQDTGEDGLNGVPVKLLGEDDNEIATTMTADDGVGSPGFYEFANLSAGTYTIQFGTLPGYLLSTDGSVEVTLAEGESATAVNAGLYRPFPDAWTAWQAKWSDELGAENAPADNPDGDRHSNLIEYAFSLSPDSGLGKPFRLVSSDVDGEVDGLFSRTTGGPQDAVYVLEWTEVLGDPTAWESQELDDNDLDISDNGDGTEAVRISDIETFTELTEGSGFVRIRVDLDDGTTMASDATEVLGWLKTGLGVLSQTYHNPFLQCSEFTGTVDSVDGQTLVMTTSAGSSDLEDLLDADVAYYIEVLSGTHEGQRFDVVVDSVEGAKLTLAVDSDLYEAAPPFNTLPGALPATLEDDLIALRRHWTLDGLFPPSGFTATDDPTTADQVQVYAGGDWVRYWLYRGEDEETPRWVQTGDPEEGMPNRGGTVIPPGQGLFFKNRGSELTLLAYGEVRGNAFVRPLAAGMNLVSGGYPVDQSARDTGGRGLDLPLLFGSLDFKTADSFFIWKADATQTSGLASYDSYWLLDKTRAPEMDLWLRVGDVSGDDQGEEALFLRDRSVFQRARFEIPTYWYPAPWVP